MAVFAPIVHDVAATRRFVVVGGRAKASADFKLHSLADSGGRIDILVRCIRAALLVADGVRRDTVLDLLLLGGPAAPLTLRLAGNAIRGMRPDERRNARWLQRFLASAVEKTSPELVAPGVTAARWSLDNLAAHGGDGALYVLDRGGQDIRDAVLPAEGSTFVLGDDRGLTDGQRQSLATRGAVALSLGPVEIHTEDAIALVHNELDRRFGGALSQREGG